MLTYRPCPSGRSSIPTRWRDSSAIDQSRSWIAGSSSTICGWGARDYETRHIPGAVFAILDKDLSAEKTGLNGRHPLPDPATFAGTLSRLGIDPSVQVVAYDQDSGMFASRFWWMLRRMSHDNVAVLDGGFAKWLAEARETASGSELRAHRTFGGAPADADAGRCARRRGIERTIRLATGRRAGARTLQWRETNRLTSGPATFPAPGITSSNGTSTSTA